MIKMYVNQTKSFFIHWKLFAYDLIRIESSNDHNPIWMMDLFKLSACKINFSSTPRKKTILIEVHFIEIFDFKFQFGILSLFYKFVCPNFMNFSICHIRISNCFLVKSRKASPITNRITKTTTHIQMTKKACKQRYNQMMKCSFWPWITNSHNHNRHSQAQALVVLLRRPRNQTFTVTS